MVTCGQLSGEIEAALGLVAGVPEDGPFLAFRLVAFLDQLPERRFTLSHPLSKANVLTFISILASARFSRDSFPDSRLTSKFRFAYNCPRLQMDSIRLKLLCALV